MKAYLDIVSAMKTKLKIDSSRRPVSNHLYFCYSYYCWWHFLKGVGLYIY